MSKAEDRPPEDERQHEDLTSGMEESLRRLIKEGSDEELQRTDLLLSIMSKTYAIQKDRKELELERFRYYAEREVTVAAEQIKLRFEAYKNITVLDSGALVAFAAVTNYLLTNPTHDSLLYGAYAATLVSLATALTMMFVLSDDLANSGPPSSAYEREEGHASPRRRRSPAVLRIIAPGGFFAGLLFFLSFLGSNL